MRKGLFKRGKGAPIKHDFEALRKGQAVRLGETAQKNPYPYIAYWNNNNKKKRLEVWRDGNNVAYAKRVK